MGLDRRARVGGALLQRGRRQRSRDAQRGLVHGDEVPQVGKTLPDPVELCRGQAVEDHRLRPAVPQPELQTVVAKQHGQRHSDGPQLIGGDMGQGHLGPLRQHDRQTIPPPNA